MKRDTQLNLLIAAVMILSVIIVSGWRTIPSQAPGSVLQVTAFGRGSGGMRIIIFNSQSNKLYEYEGNAECQNSWTLDPTGARMTQDKCK